LFLPDGHYGGIGDRLPRQAVDHPAADGIGAVLRLTAEARHNAARAKKSFIRNAGDMILQMYKIKAASRRSGEKISYVPNSPHRASAPIIKPFPPGCNSEHY